jgi:hypothetical protein
MGSKVSKLLPTLTIFDDIKKYYFDGSFQIVSPITDSTGTFTFVSSNIDVATITGNTVTIVGAGVTTITATQASDATYLTNSISADLTVSTVKVVTKNGETSNSNLNYVNKNGALGSSNGVDVNGESKVTKSN